MMSRIRSRRPSVRAKVVIGCRGARKVRSLPRGSYFVCSVVQSVAAAERLAMPLDSTATRRGQGLHLRYKKGGNRKAFQHLGPCLVQSGLWAFHSWDNRWTYFSISVMGAGIKHRTKMTIAITAQTSRLLSSGSQRLSSGGWRKPSSRINAAQTNQPLHHFAIGSNRSATPNEIRRCRSLATEYRMCPPSNWPAGSKFRAVADKPNQAARPTGCSRRSLGKNAGG